MRSQTSFERLAVSTSQQWFSVSLTLLRVAVGLQFIMAGISKMGGWSASGALENATGPLAWWFQSMAGNSVVDFANVWGLTLIGLGLIVGLMVRPASFFGAILMVLYYMVDFTGNTAHGFIDSHIILILLFSLFMAGGVSQMYGLDGFVREHFNKAGRWVSVLFG